MKLKGSQYRSLLETLLEAFPTAHALTRMVRIGLDLRMEVDIGGDNLREQVMNLLTWVESHDKLQDLLAAAREDNPGNLGLRDLAEELLAGEPATSAHAGRSDLDVTLEVLQEHERRGALGGLLARAFAPAIAQPRSVPTVPVLGLRSAPSAQVRSFGSSPILESLTPGVGYADPRVNSAPPETRSVLTLAEEYDSIRARLPSGFQRTMLMERVAAKLRAASRDILSSLDAHTASPSAGARLAAVMALQEQPRPEHLVWLSERVHAEKPFIGYHAALALREAALELAPADLPQVQAAVVHAMAAAGPPDALTERRQVLQSTLEILVRRGQTSSA
jgi:Effector-associated domain 1